MQSSVVVTGLGLELPGIAAPAALLSPETCIPDPAAFKPEDVLGKKGLLGKDRATRLALCAVKKALQDLGEASPVTGQTCGVVVSSSLGNLDTVCNVSRAINAGHCRDLSVLDLPNASSNIIASSVALRFGCKALNLAICGGADGGTQAVHLACNAILAGRATRMIVVGVEPRTAASEKLLSQSLARWLGEAPLPPLLEGAAALVLEAADRATERGARVYGVVSSGGFLHSRSLETSVANAVAGRHDSPSMWLTPNCTFPGVAAAVERTRQRWPEAAMLDLGARLGEGYGLTGVLQAVVGSIWLQDRGNGWILATSGGCCDDRFTSLTVTGSSQVKIR